MSGCRKPTRRFDASVNVVGENSVTYTVESIRKLAQINLQNLRRNRSAGRPPRTAHWREPAQAARTSPLGAANRGGEMIS